MHRQTAHSPTPLRVEGVSRETLPNLWPVLASLLQPALDIGGDNVTMDEVYGYLMAEQCMCWVVVDDEAIVAALVITLPADRNSVMVWLMGGRDFDAWRPLVEPLLKRYARDKGKPFVEAYARPGLGKKLRKAGWRVRHELVALEAGHE